MLRLIARRARLRVFIDLSETALKPLFKARISLDNSERQDTGAALGGGAPPAALDPIAYDTISRSRAFQASSASRISSTYWC
jgi:hypothetical protein